MMGTDVPEFENQDDARTRELDLREREVAAKEREVALKAEELRKSRWGNPLVIALLAATVGLLGNMGVAYLNNRNSERVERLREQSNLLVDVVKTGNPKESCQNLIFLVSLGLLDDANQTIQGQCGDKPKGPATLPLVSTTTSLLGLQQQPSELTGQVLDAVSGTAIAGATVSSGLANAVTGADGRFVISLSQGTFTFSLTVQKDGYMPQTVTTFPGMINTVRLYK